MKRIILASASPRRREILDTIGIKHEVVVSAYDESATPADLTPDMLVLVNSEGKGRAVAKVVVDNNSVVISSDTVVAMKKEDGYRVYGKPVDRQDAISMLQELSGKAHTVFTGLTIIDKSTGVCESIVDTTDVVFKELSMDEIEWYVDTFEPMDKAGSYAIQGLGARFVTSINGSYHTVMGLPAHRVYEILSNMGAL